MIGNTIAPRPPPANITLAIGTPVARLFFEPQNTMAISSARLKCRRRAMKVIESIAMASNSAAAPSTPSNAGNGIFCHSPSFTDALKAV